MDSYDNSKIKIKLKFGKLRCCINENQKVYCTIGRTTFGSRTKKTTMAPSEDLLQTTNVEDSMMDVDTDSDDVAPALVSGSAWEWIPNSVAGGVPFDPSLMADPESDDDS